MSTSLLAVLSCIFRCCSIVSVSRDARCCNEISPHPAIRRGLGGCLLLESFDFGWFYPVWLRSCRLVRYSSTIGRKQSPVSSGNRIFIHSRNWLADWRVSYYRPSFRRCPYFCRCCVNYTKLNGIFRFRWDIRSARMISFNGATKWKR